MTYLNYYKHHLDDIMTTMEEVVNSNETFSYYIFGCHEEIHSNYTFFQENINYIIDGNLPNAFERIKNCFITQMKSVIDTDNQPDQTQPKVYSWFVTQVTVDSLGKIMNGCLQFSYTLNYNQERTKDDHKLKINEELIYYSWPDDETINNIPEMSVIEKLPCSKIYLVYLSNGDVSINKYICRTKLGAEKCYQFKNLSLAPWYPSHANNFKIIQKELNNLETYYNNQIFEMHIQTSGNGFI